MYGDNDYEYIGDPVPTKKYMEEFALQKYKNKKINNLTAEDFSLMATDFNIYIEYLIKLSFILPYQSSTLIIILIQV